MTGFSTLDQSVKVVASRLTTVDLDRDAMTAIAAVYRAAGAIRNHLERTVLAPRGLTWTSWIVLWIVWSWEEIESRHTAAEAGISKSTLTGVATTLEGRGLLRRRTHPDDARRVLLSLTPVGERLMTEVFPAYHQQEGEVLAPIAGEETKQLTDMLMRVVTRLEASAPRRASITLPPDPAAAAPDPS
ncbi:MAG: MarR family transcriptional regulator [Kineosporiaceae bacterium]